MSYFGELTPRMAAFREELLNAKPQVCVERAVITADRMKSRGYGLPGRSAYRPYRMERRDRALLAAELAGAAVLGTGAAFGLLQWQYYPVCRGTWAGWPILAAYAALLALPLLLNWKEDRAWRVWQSNT